jgi:undecaprenyl-phosphate galactose phosphotransferase
MIELRKSPRDNSFAQYAVFIVGDLAALSCAIFLAPVVQNQTFLTDVDAVTKYLSGQVVHLLVVVGWFVWFLGFKQASVNRKPFWVEAKQLIAAWLAFAAIDLILIGIHRGQAASVAWLGVWTSLLVLLPIFRAAGRWVLHRSGRWNRATLIVGNGPNALRAYLALQSERSMGYVVIGFVLPSSVKSSAYLNGAPVKGLPFEVWNDDSVLPAVMTHLHYVIAMEGDQGADRDAFIRFLNDNGVDDLHVIPAMQGVPLYGQETLSIFSHDVLLIFVSNKLAHPMARISKRIFDVCVASLMIVFTLPLMAFVALQIWREDGGPFIFVQRRVGRNGQEFNFFKFRSMVNDAEDLLMAWKSSNSPEWQRYCTSNFKLSDDPRVLRVGRFIRRTSMDELPQLFNVLRGEMSLVGPRPLLARELPDYGPDISLYYLTPPGLTGVWQVSGRSSTKFSDRANLDTWYVKNWSLWTDLAILVKTVNVLVNQKGAH